MSPPNSSGLVDEARVPVRAVLAACTPFTYSRTAVPSYVAARCVQVFTASAVGAFAWASAVPNVPAATGVPVFPLASRK